LEEYFASISWLIVALK